MLLNPSTKTTSGDKPPPAAPATMAKEVKMPSSPPKMIGFKNPPSLWCQSSSSEDFVCLSSWKRLGTVKSEGCKFHRFRFIKQRNLIITHREASILDPSKASLAVNSSVFRKSELFSFVMIVNYWRSTAFLNFSLALTVCLDQRL